MIKIRKILGFIILLIFFSTYSPIYKENTNSYFFSIKKIIIENNKVIKKDNLLFALRDLKGKSLIFLNENYINSVINEFDFIASIKVKKIYPSTLKLIIKEKIPIGIYLDEKEKIFISNRGDYIPFKEIYFYENLPLVIGNKSKFIKLYLILKSVEFPIHKVKEFHYFNINRWDIVLINGKRIKLPNQNLEKILKDFISLNKEKTFDKFEIIDYRIKDQLILK